MSAKTRQQLRDLVRTQLDMDEVELTDGQLDVWFEDGLDRTLAIEDRWPFFEHQWDFTTVADQAAYTRASLAAADTDSYAVDKIEAVLDSETGELLALPHSRALQLWGIAPDTSVPAAWTERGTSIYLWPPPAAGRTVRVTGFRKPSWASTATSEVDADARLHSCLYLFGCAMAYLQQEDETLANQYLGQWQDSARQAHKSIMSAPQRRPLVMSGASTGISQTIVSWAV